jgi:hypothetical protein
MGSCDHCGKVYNPYIGHRFWSGTYHVTVDGEQVTYETLCDQHHRELVREAD